MAKWIQKAIKRPGKLGGSGFTKKPVAEQKKILRQCMRDYDYRSCLGSVQLLENIPPHSDKQRMARLRKWLVENYGRGSGKRVRMNPKKKGKRDTGTWNAVPEIIGVADIEHVRLTRKQVLLLERETA